MDRININTTYLSNHHSILGPARFMPRARWGGPIFGGGWGHFHHHRQFFGGFGGGMYEQNIYIDNGRRGFWGNLADGLMGFVNGFTNVSWLMNGMQQLNLYNPMMMSPQMPYMMPYQQAEQPAQADQNANQNYNNLKKLASANGFEVIKEQDGTYTAYNSKTKEHYSGDYETVRDGLLKGKDDDNESDNVKKKQKTDDEPTPQGAKDGETVKAEEFKKFEGKSVKVTDELRIKNGEDPDLVNIEGTTTFGEMDKKTGYPATISVGDVKYTLSQNFKDDPKYKDATLYKSDKKGEYYRLEWKNDNPILVQHEDDIKLGAGDVDFHTTKRK